MELIGIDNESVLFSTRTREDQHARYALRSDGTQLFGDGTTPPVEAEPVAQAFDYMEFNNNADYTFTTITNGPQTLVPATPYPDGWELSGNYITFPPGMYAINFYWEVSGFTAVTDSSSYLTIYYTSTGNAPTYIITPPVNVGTGWGGGSGTLPIFGAPSDPIGYVSVDWYTNDAPGTLDVRWKMTIARLGDI